MNQDQPIRPANVANIVAINQGKRPLVMSNVEPKPEVGVIALPGASYRAAGTASASSGLRTPR